LLILGRVIASAGSSVTMVLSRAIVRDMFEGHETAAVLARIALVAAVAPMIAPPIGGLISDTLGWRALFLLLAGVGAISVALVMFGLPETLREPSRRFGVRGMARSFTTLLKDRRYTAYAFNGAFVASIFFVYMTTAPFVYIGVLGVTATTYALAYMTTIGGFLVGYAIAARAAGRVSIDRMLVLGTSCSLAASCVALAVTASGWWTLWSLTVPVIALTIANGTVTPTNQAAVVSGDPRTVGAASGLAGFLQMMVGAILIQAVGALPHSTPYPMSIAMVLSGAAGLAAVVWGLRPRMAG
jgi:DHA1 family bicyclomycin/chloramphenicol resistance-like MFS transporter